MRFTSHADFTQKESKTLIQFFSALFSRLERQSICSSGQCSITLPPSVVWAGGELNVSTTSLTAQGAWEMGSLSAIKTMAGVLIYHFRHHHVVLQYPNVATLCLHCPLVLSLPPPPFTKLWKELKMLSQLMLELVVPCI